MFSFFFLFIISSWIVVFLFYHISYHQIFFFVSFFHIIILYIIYHMIISHTDFLYHHIIMLSYTHIIILYHISIIISHTIFIIIFTFLSSFICSLSDSLNIIGPLLSMKITYLLSVTAREPCNRP